MNDHQVLPYCVQAYWEVAWCMSWSECCGCVMAFYAACQWHMRLWRFLVLLEVTSMSSVLLPLNLSMFAVAKALASHIHDCIEWSSSYNLSEGADICNCKSSVNEWCMIECESIMADKGLIYMVKSIGPRTEPWGTPECTGAKSEPWLHRET